MPEKERVYTIEINLDSTDEVDLSHFLHWVAEDIEAGRLKYGKKEYANQNNVEGSVVLKEEMRCTECNGTGEITTMERVYPGEPHTAPVGTAACPCTKEQ
jgi:phosphatidylethanolamine-binding protein (PEBP) family uncharacterized protein